MKLNTFSLVLIACFSSSVFAATGKGDKVADASAWDKAAAAKYLDAREIWWQAWPKAERDHKTVCISCHTVVPYALARPGLRDRMGQNTMAAPERIMMNYIYKRVTLWNEVQPFYIDNPNGPTKSVESRGTEAVLNALILASYDRRQNHLTAITREAFSNAWAMQRTSGPKAGAWIWLNFHNAPWESDESEYHGAALAALAVGMAPDHYRKDPSIQKNLALLTGYLHREYSTQPLLNRLIVLWASTYLDGLLAEQERTELAHTLYLQQQKDGGWSLTNLGTWKRRDQVPLETKSDGYGTGLTVLVLENAGFSRDPQLRSGVKWLLQNQNKTQGFWPAWSLNKKRDPASDPARFMDDAATGFAVLALDNQP